MLLDCSTSHIIISSFMLFSSYSFKAYKNGKDAIVDIRIILLEVPMASRIEKWKLFLLFAKNHQLSSIIGAVGDSSPFCIWAYYHGNPPVKETLSAFIRQAGISKNFSVYLPTNLFANCHCPLFGALTSIAKNIFIYGASSAASTISASSSAAPSSSIWLAPTDQPLSSPSSASGPMTSMWAGWIREQSLWAFLYLYDDLAISPADFSLYAGRLDQDDMLIIVLCKPHPHHLHLRTDLYWFTGSEAHKNKNHGH